MEVEEELYDSLDEDSSSKGMQNSKFSTNRDEPYVLSVQPNDDGDKCDVSNVIPLYKGETIKTDVKLPRTKSVKSIKSYTKYGSNSSSNNCIKIKKDQKTKTRQNYNNNHGDLLNNAMTNYQRGKKSYLSLFHARIGYPTDECVKKGQDTTRGICGDTPRSISSTTISTEVFEDAREDDKNNSDDSERKFSICQNDLIQNDLPQNDLAQNDQTLNDQNQNDQSQSDYIKNDQTQSNTLLHSLRQRLLSSLSKFFYFSFYLRHIEKEYIEQKSNDMISAKYLKSASFCSFSSSDGNSRLRSVSQQCLDSNCKPAQKKKFNKRVPLKVPTLGYLGPDTERNKNKLELLRKKQMYGQTVSDKNRIKFLETKVLSELKNKMKEVGLTSRSNE